MAEGPPLCQLWEDVLPCSFFPCRAWGLRQWRAPAPSRAWASQLAYWCPWISRLVSRAASEAAAIGWGGKWIFLCGFQLSAPGRHALKHLFRSVLI